jgi:hypothetical protein
MASVEPPAGEPGVPSEPDHDDFWKPVGRGRPAGASAPRTGTRRPATADPTPSGTDWVFEPGHGDVAAPPPDAAPSRGSGAREESAERLTALIWKPPGSADIEPEAATGPESAQVAVPTTAPPIGPAYRSLLDRIEADCREVLAHADAEAEATRLQAETESRRIVADAHRERSLLLARASAQQAQMYQEAEREIEGWFEALDDERAAVLGAAREEADRMLRAVVSDTRERANARLAAAEAEATRIIDEATAEAERRRQVALAAAAPPVPDADAAPEPAPARGTPPRRRKRFRRRRSA